MGYGVDVEWGAGESQSGDWCATVHAYYNANNRDFPISIIRKSKNLFVALSF